MSDSPFAATSPPANRLSIAHLLLWTATSAVCLAVDGRLLPPALAIVICPVCGLGLLGLGLTAAPLFGRKIAFPTQPGHWLLLFIGTAWLVAHFGLLAEWANLSSRYSVGFPVAMVLFWVVGCILSLQAVQALKNLWIWRNVFLCLVAMFVSIVFVGCLNLIALIVVFCFGFAALLLGLIATLDDVVRLPPRDWLHWAGVGGIVALTLLGMAVVVLDGGRWL